MLVNEACCEWLGDAAEDLLGRRCVYQSGAELTGPDAVASQLCPPPLVLCGREMTADVARINQQGIVYRRARFVPLSISEDRLIGVVALVDDIDRTEPSEPQVASSDDESIVLHEQVRRFHQEAAVRFGIDRLIGTSPAIVRARAQAELAVGVRASVVLIGPPGSGRRHMAETIHYAQGIDSVGAMVPLDCQLLGPELIHSSLRALTLGNPLGEETSRSTLLLLDADRLPPEIQSEMATALASTRFTMRVMATAEHSLVDAARHGHYREDLAALLSTIAIELPPLVQRRVDVPPLAQMFLEEINVTSSKQLVGFAAEAMDRLASYNWPGNLDELAVAVAECHRRAAGRQITVDDLPDRLRFAAEAAARPRRKEETIVLDEFLARIERELIRRALARSKGNKTKAARLLGLNRPRLYRRMVQLGLIEEGSE